jgi:uncharacterized protein YkwD
VPSWIDGSRVRARFAPDRPGAFEVQILASVEGGPRPVIDAAVFADVEPPTRPDEAFAPGEKAGDPQGSADDLARMLDVARASSGEPPLVRDSRLDALARDHAERMIAAGVVAHDAGDGDPASRLRAAGVTDRDVGENVARAANLGLAHRALWASPSHRANILHRSFGRAGFAVVRAERAGADPVEDVWVVELFTSSEGGHRAGTK